VSDLNITITVDGATAHVCGGMCDCPKAIARAQEAIDADRAQHGGMPRRLSERIRGMRNAAPSERWFDVVGREADRLEDLLDRERGYTQAANARILELQSRAYQASATIPSIVPSAPTGPLPMASNMDAALVLMLRSTVAHTVDILRRAECLPELHELVMITNGAHLYAGPAPFVVRLADDQTDNPPAGRYVVFTTDENADGSEPGDAVFQRFTNDLDDVRAWLTAWAVAIAHP
jgi:hypothetical protein